MHEYRVLSNLHRAVVGDFAFPLGIVPQDVEPPQQGYTVEYHLGEDDDPDSYAFHIVVSHERIRTVLLEAMQLLRADEVFGIIEIGSRDAYRSMDLFRGERAFSLEAILETWAYFEPFLMEDSSIGAGLYSLDPFVEIFLDAWKGIVIHVPVLMREEVESHLATVGLSEVMETWATEMLEDAHRFGVRPVLALDDEYAPDVDELLLELRDAWDLELDIDPTTNVDEVGRSLGRTLWHALAIVCSTTNPDDGAYASIWATAESLDAFERLVQRTIADYPQYALEEYYWRDRVAFDDRPTELDRLEHRRDADVVHLVSFEPWHDECTAPPPTGSVPDPRQGGALDDLP